MAALADSDDLIARFDERTIADLASDTGTPASSLGSNAKVTAALESASGQVLSACTVSDLYDEDDLAALAGNSGALLKDLVCGLAMVRLLRRRPDGLLDQDSLKAVAEAEEYLERLRKGERVFGLAANREAGLPSIDGPTAIEYDTLNLIPERCRGFYPARAQRLPIGRG